MFSPHIEQQDTNAWTCLHSALNGCFGPRLTKQQLFGCTTCCSGQETRHTFSSSIAVTQDSCCYMFVLAAGAWALGRPARFEPLPCRYTASSRWGQQLGRGVTDLRVVERETQPIRFHVGHRSSVLFIHFAGQLSEWFFQRHIWHLRSMPQLFCLAPMCVLAAGVLLRCRSVQEGISCCCTASKCQVGDGRN